LSDYVKTYGGVGYAIGSGFNPALPPNNGVKLTAYRRDSQPQLAHQGFGKRITSCWPGSSLRRSVRRSSNDVDLNMS
jgi:hypothetical protein